MACAFLAGCSSTVEPASLVGEYEVQLRWVASGIPVAPLQVGTLTVSSATKDRLTGTWSGFLDLDGPIENGAWDYFVLLPDLLTSATGYLLEARDGEVTVVVGRDMRCLLAAVTWFRSNDGIRSATAECYVARR